MTVSSRDDEATATEELALFRALASASGADRERLQEELVRRYSGLVKWMANQYANPSLDRDDLEQVGFVGLVLAIQRFDPERGSGFISFARPTVQGEIRRYFRDKRRWIRLPRRLQETKAVLAGASEKLTHRLGRAPTVHELAVELAVDEELVLEAMTADDHFTCQSLDMPAHSESGEAGATLADTIGQDEGTYDLILSCRAVGPLIAQLPPRDREILELRFFQELTQAEIGERLGYSQMHISRLLARILADLRAALEPAEAC
jgi:RNA polymerase sigma-B factor